jgi:protein O-GlcNAc transferase
MREHSLRQMKRFHRNLVHEPRWRAHRDPLIHRDSGQAIAWSLLPRRFLNRRVWGALAGVIFVLSSCSGGREALHVEGREHHERGELDQAIESYRQALEQDPTRPEVLADLGAAYYDRGDVFDAALSCEKALELDPENHAARAVLARAYLDLGHAQEALPHALKATESPRPEEFALWTLSAVYLALGKFEDAERMYRMTLESVRFPDDPVGPAQKASIMPKSDRGYLYLGLGLACEGQGRYADALAWLDSAEVYIPFEAQVFFEEGILYEDHGQYAEARECYRRAIRIAPEDAGAQIRLAVVLYQLGDLLTARDMLLAVYSEYIPDAEAVYTLGRIAEQRGFTHEAGDYYREAREIDPAMASAWLREGLILRKLGFEEDAVTCLQQARDRGSSAAAWILDQGGKAKE